MHREGLHIDEERGFHFSSESGVPDGLRGKEHVCFSSGNPVTVTLQPIMVRCSTIVYINYGKNFLASHRSK